MFLVMSVSFCSKYDPCTRQGLYKGDKGDRSCTWVVRGGGGARGQGTSTRHVQTCSL